MLPSLSAMKSTPVQSYAFSIIEIPLFKTQCSLSDSSLTLDRVPRGLFDHDQQARDRVLEKAWRKLKSISALRAEAEKNTRRMYSFVLADENNARTLEHLKSYMAEIVSMRNRLDQTLEALERCRGVIEGLELRLENVSGRPSALQDSAEQSVIMMETATSEQAAVKKDSTQSTSTF
ncbi:hypothetical protein OF83DRAFT_1171484 [Amylostereum chailletii]|nr:hypothetical protein OF83DRAFT_1171484 [Amylostereum chailletii]